MTGSSLLRCLPFVRVAEPVRFPPGTGAGNRTSPRRPLVTSARVREVEGDAGALPLELDEVSATGAFVHSQLLLPLGAAVEIAFALPTTDEIVAHGRVVRVEERGGRAGMGIEFERMPPDARARLRAYSMAGHA